MFSVDTDVFITAWNVTYPPDVFPTFWTKFEAAIKSGSVQSCSLVPKEIERGDDSLVAWTRGLKADLVVPDCKELIDIAADIVSAHSTLVTAIDSIGADPFVIALAELRGWTVVSNENPVGPGAKKTKIPNVCEARGVKCVKTLPFLRALGWSI